jgi:hypothetical protein
MLIEVIDGSEFFITITTLWIWMSLIKMFLVERKAENERME